MVVVLKSTSHAANLVQPHNAKPPVPLLWALQEVFFIPHCNASCSPALVLQEAFPAQNAREVHAAAAHGILALDHPLMRRCQVYA